jgi:hypothetical protein
VQHVYTWTVVSVCQHYKTQLSVLVWYKTDYKTQLSLLVWYKTDYKTQLSVLVWYKTDYKTQLSVLVWYKTDYKTQLSVLVWYKTDIIIPSKCNLFSPWYCGNIAYFAWNSNHSDTHHLVDCFVLPEQFIMP